MMRAVAKPACAKPLRFELSNGWTVTLASTPAGFDLLAWIGHSRHPIGPTVGCDQAEADEAASFLRAIVTMPAEAVREVA